MNDSQQHQQRQTTQEKKGRNVKAASKRYRKAKRTCQQSMLEPGFGSCAHTQNQEKQTCVKLAQANNHHIVRNASHSHEVSRGQCFNITRKSRVCDASVELQNLKKCSSTTYHAKLYRTECVAGSQEHLERYVCGIEPGANTHQR